MAENVPACIIPDDKPEELDLVSQYRTLLGKQGELAHIDLTGDHGNAMKAKFFVLNMAGKIQFQIIGMGAGVDNEVIAEGELDMKLGGQYLVGYDWNTKPLIGAHRNKTLPNPFNQSKRLGSMMLPP